jgi:hypothetical protein
MLGRRWNEKHRRAKIPLFSKTKGQFGMARDEKRKPALEIP